MITFYLIIKQFKETDFHVVIIREFIKFKRNIVEIQFEYDSRSFYHLRNNQTCDFRSQVLIINIHEFHIVKNSFQRKHNYLCLIIEKPSKYF